MIILEGPDGAGKTTLLSMLKKHLPFPTQPKAVNSDTSHAVDLKQYVQSTIINERGHFSRKFYDRFALVSGLIYAPILNDEYQLNLYNNVTWYNKWYDEFTKVRPIVILCLPPLATVINNTRNDPVVSKHIKEIYDGYREWLLVHEAHVYDYTESKDPVFKVLNYINRELEDRGDQIKYD